jgi:hypothetical protein
MRHFPPTLISACSVFAGSQLQIEHFIGQVDFFEAIYAASGAFGIDPNRTDLLARAELSSDRCWG